MRRIQTVILAAILIISSFSLAACGNPTKPAAEQLPEIIVGVDDFEPFTSLNESGEFVGIDIDIATEAFSRMGYKPVFRLINWDNKEEVLKNGEIDCIWSCISMNGRTEQYKWAGPYLKSRQVAIVRENKNIHKLSDLSDANVSVSINSKPSKILIDGSLGFTVKNVYAFSLVSEVFEAMRSGYTDACAGHEIALKVLMTGDEDDYRELEDTIIESDLGVAFDKSEKDFPVELLSETLKGMKEDGTLGKIAREYGLDPNKVLE